MFKICIRVTAAIAIAAATITLIPVAAAAADSCARPSRLDTAQLAGTTATVEQMKSMQQQFATFMADGKAYQRCLEKSGIAGDRLASSWDEMQNEMERAAALFNRELRRFKQRSDIASGNEAPAPVVLN